MSAQHGQYLRLSRAKWVHISDDKYKLHYFGGFDVYSKSFLGAWGAGEAPHAYKTRLLCIYNGC